MSVYKLSLVAGGLAVVLAACASSATPEPTSEPAAAPPAAEEEAPPTTDVEAPPATEEEAMEEIIPSVTVSDQVAANGNISVAQVSATEPSWIVIHAQADGAPGPAIGFAAIEVGNNANVAVEIDLDQATETLYAMLHLDLGAAGEYEFPGDDAPVFDAGGDVVLTPFTLLEAQASAGEEVKVIDINFQAKVVTVPVGTTVTWVYDGALPHTVTSDTNVFNSGTMGEGDVFTFTFTEEGSFPYFCMFHGGKGGSGMSGVVNVTEG